METGQWRALRDEQMPIKQKGQFYSTVARLTMLYGLERWEVNKTGTGFRKQK